MSSRELVHLTTNERSASYLLDAHSPRTPHVRSVLFAFSARVLSSSGSQPDYQMRRAVLLLGAFCWRQILLSPITASADADRGFLTPHLKHIHCENRSIGRSLPHRGWVQTKAPPSRSSASLECSKQADEKGLKEKNSRKVPSKLHEGNEAESHITQQAGARSASSVGPRPRSPSSFLRIGHAGSEQRRRHARLSSGALPRFFIWTW